MLTTQHLQNICRLNLLQNVDNVITVQQVIAPLFNTILFAAAIGLGSLVIFIVNAVKKRKTGRTYSSWYVIVTHLSLIVLLLVVTRFISVNLFSIANADIVNAALIMDIIFLLALRSPLRNRCLRNLIMILFNLSMILPTALMVTFEKPVRMTLKPAIFIAVYTTIKVFLAVLQLKHRASTANTEVCLFIKEMKNCY